MPGFYFNVVERAQGVIDRFGQERFMDEIEGYIWHVEQFERYLEAGFRYKKLKLTAYNIIACLKIHEYDMAERLLPKLLHVAKAEDVQRHKYMDQVQEDAAEEIYFSNDY